MATNRDQLTFARQSDIAIARRDEIRWSIKRGSSRWEGEVLGRRKDAGGRREFVGRGAGREATAIFLSLVG